MNVHLSISCQLLKSSIAGHNHIRHQLRIVEQVARYRESGHTCAVILSYFGMPKMILAGTFN